MPLLLQFDDGRGKVSDAWTKSAGWHVLGILCPRSLLSDLLAQLSQGPVLDAPVCEGIAIRTAVSDTDKLVGDSGEKVLMMNREIEKTVRTAKPTGASSPLRTASKTEKGK